MRILIEDCPDDAQVIIARAIAATIKHLSLGPKQGIFITQGYEVNELYVEKPIDTFEHELPIGGQVRIVVAPAQRAFQNVEELEAWRAFAAGFAASANNDTGGMFDTSRVVNAADLLLEAFRKRTVEPHNDPSEEET